MQQTIVAEIYGPDYQKQIKLAAEVRKVFQQTDGMVDIGWFVAAPENQYSLQVDSVQAALVGLTPQ